MAGNTVTPDQVRAFVQERFQSVFGDLQTPQSPFTADTASRGGSAIPRPDDLDIIPGLTVTAPPRPHTDGSGTIPMGPLQTMTPTRRRAALAAADPALLRRRSDHFVPPLSTADRVVAGRSRAASRSSRTAGPVRTGSSRGTHPRTAGPTLRMQGGERVRVGQGIDAHSELRPRLAVVPPQIVPVVQRPIHYAPGVEGRIQRLVTRANDCLSRGDLRGAQSAVDRAHVMARHARGLSVETLCDLGDTGVAIRRASEE